MNDLLKEGALLAMWLGGALAIIHYFNRRVVVPMCAALRDESCDECPAADYWAHTLDASEAAGFLRIYADYQRPFNPTGLKAPCGMSADDPDDLCGDCPALVEDYLPGCVRSPEYTS